jgi:hypothetical protein
MRTRHLTVVGLLASALAVGLITGCAQGTGTPSAGGSSSVSPTPSPSVPPPSSSSSASSSPDPSSPADSASPEPTGDITVSGQVEAGVEPSCLILRTGDKTYQLMGGDKNIVKAGSNVVVRGHVVRGVMSYCMQGQPFQVTEAHLS